MRERLIELWESTDRRDLVQVAILAVAIYGVLRLLNRSQASGIVRGLGLLFVGGFAVAQLLISVFDLHELGKVLDYLLTTVVLSLLVIFQQELRRGLMLLGRYRAFRWFAPRSTPVVDALADTVEALSRDRVGALIALERETSLENYVETGETVDAALSPALLESIFTPPGPLHDGAIIVQHGRVTAAGCQLPLAQPTPGFQRQGMRHRAALGLSEETDAVLVIVSEETGRVSLASGGKLEAVDRDQFPSRLAALLSA